MASLLFRSFVDIINALLLENPVKLSEHIADSDQTELNLVMFRAILLTDNSDLLEVLLSSGAHVNHQDKDGRTPLFLAVKYGRVNVVTCLIERGCEVNLGKFNQSNTLHLAAKKGNPEIVELLLNAGHNLDSVNWGGNTALLIACRFGHKLAVNALLSAGAKVNVCNKLGHYPLHYAAFAGDKDLVYMLIEHGATPDVRTHLGINPLMLACERHKCTVVEILSGCSDLEHHEQLYGGTVLHWAVASGCNHCVAKLLEVGADLHATDHSGRTAFIQAIQSNYPFILQNLLTRLDSRDFEVGALNACALHVAAYLGHDDCIDVLCQSAPSGGLINQLDFFGSSPLDLAVSQVNKQAVISLLLANATVCQLTLPKSVSPISLLINAPSGSNGLDDVSTKLLALKMGLDKFTPLPPPFKTYSPVKMAMIDMLRSAPGEQMVAPIKFDFNTWLDNGPEAFVLKVTSLDLTDWLYQRMHTPWSLRELCRGGVRQSLGYRALEKVECLPLPQSLIEYLNMKELEEIQTDDIQIRSTCCFDDIDVE